MKQGLFLSLLLHSVLLALFSGFIVLPQQEPQVLKVTLVSLPAPVVEEKPKQEPEPAAGPPKPPEKIKTQASAAPKEAPKKTRPEPPKPAKDVPTVKVAEKPKPKPKPEPPKPPKPKEEPKPVAKKKQEEAKKRPPKLDKTPDKTQAVRNKDPEAKTVAKADDFLAALDFAENMRKQAERPEIKIEDMVLEDSDDLSLEDQAALTLIKRKIEFNWLFPAGTKDADKLKIQVQVKLKPDGSVVSVRVTKSSGEEPFDQSLRRAVLKAAPLPIPADRYEKFSDVKLNFGEE